MNRLWLSAAILAAAGLTLLASAVTALPLGLNVQGQGLLDVEADVSVGVGSGGAAPSDEGAFGPGAPLDASVSLASGGSAFLAVDPTTLQVLGSGLQLAGAATPNGGGSGSPGAPTGTDPSVGAHASGGIATGADAKAHGLSGGDVVTPLVTLGVVLVLSKGLLSSIALSVPGLGLFSRLDRSELLAHPTRSRIYEAISASPGVNIQSLAETAGSGWGNTVYHLRRMLDAGLIASVKVNGSRTFWIAGCEKHARTDAHRALAKARSQPIGRFILAHPGVSQKEVADRMDLSKGAVSKYVKRLAAAELVEVDKQGRETMLYPTEKLTEMLDVAAGAPVPADQVPAAQPGILEREIVPA